MTDPATSVPFTGDAEADELLASDSMALLIAMAALGLLPVGPSLGAATTVLILGSKGVAQTAAAGALLTATGAVGALLFASWALLDRLRTRRRSVVDSARR